MKHPSLPKKAPTHQRRPTIHGMEIPEKGQSNARKELVEKFKASWQRSNEEEMLLSLRAQGGLVLKVQFLMGSKDRKYIPVKGKSILMKKIPSSGLLLRIIKRMTDAALEEIRETDLKWERGELEQANIPDEI